MTFLRTAPTFLVLTVALPLLAGDAASAQTDADRLEALRACLDIESDAARLLCFESIVGAEPAGTEAPGDRAAGTGTNEGIERAAEVERQEATAASGRDDGIGESAEDRREQARPTPAQPAAGTRADDAAPERRRDRDRAREEAAAETIVIVEARREYRGNAIFVTGDGRRFLQTSGNTARVLPEAPFEATLADGAFGSVFLVVRSAGLRVRVREQTE